MARVSYGNQPFREQISFFLAKQPVPTARWDDVWRDGHDTGFMVAGATKAALLGDLQKAVASAVEGGSLHQFRQDFERIVEQRGWVGWTGSESAKGRAWRTKVIYETNLRTSYAAGRWQQIQANKDHMPYVQYKHSDSVRYPRPLHLRWDGLILHVDDEWLQTHAPPNGWGCKCRLVALSRSAMRRRGLTPGPAPDDGINPKTGAPNGIDKGWDYAPGASRLPQQQEALRRQAQKLPEEIKAGLLRDLDAALARRGRDAPDLPVVLGDAVSAERSFADWADALTKTKTPRNAYRELGTLSVAVLDGLASRSVRLTDHRVLIRDTELVHMIRDAKSKKPTKTGLQRVVGETDLYRMPEIVQHPKAVLWDTQDEALLYIFEPANREAGKVVVRVDYKTKLVGEGKQRVNVVRTAGLVNMENLIAPRYQLLEGSL